MCEGLEGKAVYVTFCCLAPWNQKASLLKVVFWYLLLSARWCSTCAPWFHWLPSRCEFQDDRQSLRGVETSGLVHGDQQGGGLRKLGRMSTSFCGRSSFSGPWSDSTDNSIQCIIISDSISSNIKFQDLQSLSSPNLRLLSAKTL